MAAGKMRILTITAGAGGMYCGSCFRDNALATELLARNLDVSLVPVYTPTRTDETNVSNPRVLFGGISIYLQQYAAAFRNLPRFVDRLWDSPRVIGAFASRAVSTDARLLGDLTVSMLEGEHGVLRREFDKLVDFLKDEPPPDVIVLPNSLLIAMAAPLKRAFGCPVCCTLQGEELFVSELIEPYQSRVLELIRGHVPEVDHFIAVSRYCAGFMSEWLKIPSDRMSVVPLGIRMDGYGAGDEPASGRSIHDPFTIAYFARIAPEKGLHVLADAYIRLRKRIGSTPRLRLTAAGYLSGQHAKYLKDVRTLLASAGLEHEFSYVGEVDRKSKLAFLNAADVLSVPATYDEPKGMFLLEAMASAVPVVEPRRGAFTEVIEATGGGVLVDPDSPEKLVDGLYSLWADPALRRSLAVCAYDGVRAHYTIARSADQLLEVFGGVLRKQPSRASVA